MAEEETIRRLVLVGAMLSFIMIIYFLYLILFWIPNFIPFIIPPGNEWVIPFLMTIYYFIFAILINIGIILAPI
jgi:hypothetical protein